MKKTMAVSLLVVAAVLLSACTQAIHTMGGYTSEEYNAQTTQIADLNGQVDGLETENGELDSQVRDLNNQMKALYGQVDELNKAKEALANYKEIICPDHTWDELNATAMYELSYGNAALIQIEKDTNTKFYLTQWVPFGQPDLPEGSGFFVLTVDNYAGIALDQRGSCVVLDPFRWDAAK